MAAKQRRMLGYSKNYFDLIKIFVLRLFKMAATQRRMLVYSKNCFDLAEMCYIIKVMINYINH